MTFHSSFILILHITFILSFFHSLIDINMYLLGYDIGSSSVKASLVNAESGRCVSSAFFPKTEAEIIAVKPGWAEQDPGNWWENLKLATQAVLAESGVNAEDIKRLVSLIRCMAWYV